MRRKRSSVTIKMIMVTRERGTKGDTRGTLYDAIGRFRIYVFNVFDVFTYLRFHTIWLHRGKCVWCIWRIWRIYVSVFSKKSWPYLMYLAYLRIWVFLKKILTVFNVFGVFTYLSFFSSKNLDHTWCIWRIWRIYVFKFFDQKLPCA